MRDDINDRVPLSTGFEKGDERESKEEEDYRVIREKLEHLNESYNTQMTIIMSLCSKLDIINTRMTNFEHTIQNFCTNFTKSKTEFHSSSVSLKNQQQLQNTCAYKKIKVSYIIGFPCMKIKELKEKIAQICEVDKSKIANLDFLPFDGLTEILLETSITAQFINNISKIASLKIVPSLKIIMNDKAGFLYRTGRMRSSSVKSETLKQYHYEIEKILTTSEDNVNEDELRKYTIDDLL